MSDSTSNHINAMSHSNSSIDKVSLTVTDTSKGTTLNSMPEITISQSNPNTTNSNHNSRSRSSSILKEKRAYSYSVSSVRSSDDDDVPATNPYTNRNRKLSEYDLENQIIQTAGGQREDVYCFVFKLLILMAVVFGSGVLIFCAL